MAFISQASYTDKDWTNIAIDHWLIHVKRNTRGKKERKKQLLWLHVLEQNQVHK